MLVDGTLHHYAWICPTPELVQCGALDQNITDVVKRAALEPANVFWSRALLSKSEVSQIALPPFGTDLLYESVEGSGTISELIFTDGSGSRSSCRYLRRCGWACVLLTAKGVLCTANTVRLLAKFSLFFVLNLVLSFRLFAISPKRRREIILEGGAPPTHVHIVSDCMSVVVAHGKGPRGIHKGASHRDLWRDLFSSRLGLH